MTGIREGLYPGRVSHTRVRPVHHRLSYQVFAILFDCGRLDALARRLRLFSRNRFNLFSLHDKDHGDGSSLEGYARKLVAGTPEGARVTRFMMLCYPRILGYTFNPLTVYYGIDADGDVCVVIYEVNNTFGERKTYVLPAERPKDGVIAQSCAKELYVSPFNTETGTYSFHLTPPEEGLTVGVALKDEAGPLLKAHFRGTRQDLSDRALLKALVRTGWMTAKVFGAIHFEAARLWLKGLRLKPRPPAPETPVTYGHGRREVLTPGE